MRPLALLATLALMACGDNSSSQAPDRSLETLRLAALSIRVGDATIDVEAEAWRSFQPRVSDTPRSRGEGDSLLALVRLRSDGAPIPTGLLMDGVYLIRGSEVAAVTAREEQSRPDGARFAEFMVRNGPHWPPGDSIDVVVALRDDGGRTMLLRAPRVPIMRVD